MSLLHSFPRLYQLIHAKMTWVIVLILTAIHGYGIVSGNFIRLWSYFGCSRESIVQGRLWTLLSHGLLHAGFVHLGLNVLMLLLLGSRLEWIIGSRRVVILAFCGVIFGAVFHLCLVPSGALLVGSSGAVMAFLIYFCAISPDSLMLPIPLHARNIGLGVMISSLLLALMNPELGLPILSNAGKWMATHFGNAIFMIGHACHFGGCLAGVLLARWHLRIRHTRESILAERR